MVLSNILIISGFVNTAEVTLCNTSEIPMTYHLRVPSDSGKESLQDDNKETDTAPPVSSIREFTIRPHTGSIPPDLSQDIQVYTVMTSFKLQQCLCVCIIRWTLLQYTSRTIQ